jgi:hypothetical protein
MNIIKTTFSLSPYLPQLLRQRHHCCHYCQNLRRNYNYDWSVTTLKSRHMLQIARRLENTDPEDQGTYLSWNVLAALFVGRFVSCLWLIHALLLVDSATLLIRNTSVDLMTFLFVH